MAASTCYARPSHEYLGFSAGLDFESRIVVKEDAPKLLRDELSSPRWQPRVLAMSGITDPLSTRRTPSPDHPPLPRGVGRNPPSRGRDHQERAGDERHRPAHIAGKSQRRDRSNLPHHPGWRSGPHHGAAGQPPEASFGSDPGAQRCGHSHLRPDVTRDSRYQRSRNPKIVGRGRGGRSGHRRLPGSTSSPGRWHRSSKPGWSNTFQTAGRR